MAGTRGWDRKHRSKPPIKAREQHSGQPPTRPVQQSRETWGVRETRRPWMATTAVDAGPGPFEKRREKMKTLKSDDILAKKSFRKIIYANEHLDAKLLGTTQWKKGTRSTQPVPTLVPSFMRGPVNWGSNHPKWWWMMIIWNPKSWKPTT